MFLKMTAVKLKKINIFRTLHKTTGHRALWKKVSGTSREYDSREGDSHDLMILCRHTKKLMMH